MAQTKRVIEVQRHYQTKCCSTCYKSKPLDQFHPDPRYVRGVRGQCKDCTNAKVRERAGVVRATPKKGFKQKVCVTCKVEKPPTDFARAPDKIDGYSSRCKSCRRTIEWADELPEVRDRRGKRNLLRYKYGLTLADYAAMIAAQERKCACCDAYMDRIYVDHCHASGKVRALVCCACNTALGVVERPGFIAKALAYLKTYG